MGKGLLTLNPHHSDRLLSPTAVAGLLATMFCCLDMKATVLAKYHHVLFYLTAAMQVRLQRSKLQSAVAVSFLHVKSQSIRNK